MFGIKKWQVWMGKMYLVKQTILKSRNLPKYLHNLLLLRVTHYELHYFTGKLFILSYYQICWSVESSSLSKEIAFHLRSTYIHLSWNILCFVYIWSKRIYVKVTILKLQTRQITKNLDRVGYKNLGSYVAFFIFCYVK